MLLKLLLLLIITTQLNDEICEYGSQGNLETKHMMNMMTNLKCLIDIETSECAIQADFDREMIVVR